MKPVSRYALPPARRAAAPARPGRRGIRILRRILVAVVLLGAIGLAAFTWFAYWPLEGKVDQVESLVPADVDFLYRTSWAELERGGWVRRNVWDDPLLPALDPKTLVVDDKGTTLAQSLERIPETEAEINESVPGVAARAPGARLRLEGVPGREGPLPRRDRRGRALVRRREPGGGASAVARAPGPDPRVPAHEVRLRGGEARLRPGARDPRATSSTCRCLEGGLLRIELRNMRPPRRKVTCEGGFEMGSMTVWWAVRVKDVLAFTNSEDLARRTLDVAKGGDERAVDRPGFDVERPEGGVAASLDLTGLRSYLNRFFSSGDDSQRFGAFLGKFVAIDALDRMGATVTPLPDGIVARADVSYSDDRLRNFRDVLATYELAPTSVADGIARLLPAKDTAIVVQLKTPPRALLHAMFESFGKVEQKLIEDNVKRARGGAASARASPRTTTSARSSTRSAASSAATRASPSPASRRSSTRSSTPSGTRRAIPRP